MIPVDKDSPFYPKDERPQSLPTRNQMDSSTTNNNNNSKSMDSVVLSPEEEDRKNIDEFLGKIDSNLAESRKFVAKSQKSYE